jgi:hypothetical protein
MKKPLHKIPGFKELDEWTDTETGKTWTVFLACLAILGLLILWLSHAPR